MNIYYVLNTIMMGLLGQIQYMESVNVIEVATISTFNYSLNVSQLFVFRKSENWTLTS